MPTQPVPDPLPPPEVIARASRSVMKAVAEAIAAQALMPYVLITIDPAKANCIGVWMLDPECNTAGIARILREAADAVLDPARAEKVEHIPLDLDLDSPPEGCGA